MEAAKGWSRDRSWGGEARKDEGREREQRG
jgi:hypothetical protein